MSIAHLAFLIKLLDSIPYVAERPRPQGIQAAKRWSGLLLDLLLHPTHWNKLGFAVQWAKWIEWEGGIDFKSPIRSPSILYLQNPLHPFALNNMLNLVDFSLVDVKTLVECVDTGDWSCLLKKYDHPAEGNGASDPKKDRDEACRLLQDLCILSFYLRYGLGLLSSSSSLLSVYTVVDQQEQENDRLVQNLVTRITNNKEATTSATRNIWRQAFSEQALRLSCQKDPQNGLLPSKLSVFLNEVLETIRLNKLRQDGWTNLAVTDKLSDSQFQQLGRHLSTSFFTIMEFANVSLFLPIENITFLSKFATQLPASWYSDDFLRTTILMAKRYLHTEQREKTRIPIQVQGLVAISTLWSFWMRKIGSGDVNILGQELIEIITEVLSTTSLFTGSESRGLLSACFSGLAMGLDKWSGLMEPKIVQGMVAGLEHGRVYAQNSDMDGLQASLATVLRSDIVDRNPESIKKLVITFLQSFYGSPSLLQPMSVNNLDELFQILRLFQFVVTHKAGLLPVRAEESNNKKNKKRKPKKSVNLKGLAWFEALIHGVQDTSAKGAVPGLLAVAGILRALQHGEDDFPKVDSESLALIQDLFLSKLKAFTEAMKAEAGGLLPSQTQACLAFATCHTMPSLPTCKILGAADCSLFATLLTDYVFQPNEGIMPVNEILRVINYELAQERNRLLLNGEANQVLTRIVEAPLFTEMGRIARTVAALIEGMEDWHQIEGVILQKMHSFAVNLHVDWARCGLSSRTDSFVERRRDAKEEEVLDSETAKTTATLFRVFKTVLFAYTMIFGSIVEKSLTAAVPRVLISQLNYLILDSYAHMYFIAYKLGPGSFQVYEDLITSILTRMVMTEELTIRQEHGNNVNNNNHSLHSNVLLNKTLKAMMPRAELGYYDPVRESRTLFFMNFLERVMIAIEDRFLEDKLLPMVYPYLLKNDQRDLFESAHSVVMAVFLTNKNIAKQLAPFYSNLLLQHFPKQINIDQLRAAFTTMIKSLSETEDALAWLCVEKLLERIQQYDELSESEVEAEADAESGIGVVTGTLEEKQERTKEKVPVQVATAVHQDLSQQESAPFSPSLGSTTPLSQAASRLLTPSSTSLERQKERSQLVLALFDQLSSVNLIFVETLGEKIRELLAKEQSLVGRQALLKCIFDVVGGPAVDHTKREWAVKWYLGLVNELGRGSTSSKHPISNTTPNSSILVTSNHL
ncbi:hypothetical protein BGZ65_012657 [Modicella reniformis]|uniref:Uncharacterized protein n=1 Tax=Modicella reniformis TaxID=1440133 RepID=A0A9P6SVE6_9FUNG|nr:hypothetical protein BGZ65_012657 [Modicella reniformis]